MAEIWIMKKPESVSYGEIRDLLHKAHQDNFDRGIVFQTMQFSPEELENFVRSNSGITFVAMDGDILAGTASCWPFESKRWCHKGTVLKWMLLGVLPEYRGLGITSLLLNAVETEAKNKGLNVLYFDTAEKNTHMIKVGEKKGFIPVVLFAPRSNHYSVVMMKWLNGCPYSAAEMKKRYWKSVVKTKWKYKPGRIPRFGKTEKKSSSEEE